MGDSPERALARVDLAAVARNCRTLKDAAGGAALCAVVKADGYGHGHAAVARAALDGGATWLAVATANEARALRDEGIDARLLVMGALTPADLDTALAADADVVAWTGELLDWIDERGAAARVHVKLDSGMGRLGTADPERGARALPPRRRVRAARACRADDALRHRRRGGDEHFGRQLERFAPLAAEVREAYPGAVVHAANSAATLQRAARAFRHGALRRGDLRPRPVRPATRASAASSPRWRSSPTWPP